MSAMLKSEQTYSLQEGTQAMTMEVWLRRDTVNLRVDRRCQRQSACTGCHQSHRTRRCRLCSWTMYSTRVKATRAS